MRSPSYIPVMVEIDEHSVDDESDNKPECRFGVRASIAASS
jgi:hypothetical protein